MCKDPLLLPLVRFTFKYSVFIFIRKFILIEEYVTRMAYIWDV